MLNVRRLLPLYSSFSVDSVLFLLTFFWSFCCSFLWSPFDFAPQKLPTERGCHDSRLQFCASLFFFSIKIFQCWIILWFCTMWTRMYAQIQVEERVFNKCVLLNNSLFFFPPFHIKIKLKTGFFSKTLSHLFYLIRFTHLVFLDNGLCYFVFTNFPVINERKAIYFWNNLFSRLLIKN